ncbi:hypothetical protein AAGG91_002947 [Salmonella enterica]|uniref:hypothetical protein n=1 Tax=Salmonella enterica TaxID=28901 RepID=UPI000FDF7DE1|nr:hypothetical protein CPT_Munch_188 [Salmonella phage Munch]ECV9084112.1 hypothetical protein [Salmonella enterica subsp. enterica serovar Infantis]ELL7856570.1 hypothetical protein [Salmonella enterica]MCP0435787.1 hypothetical protein [Salmonella enterica subsp. enterica serovar Mbandaka]QCW18874.1 hypothetical protein 7t3_0353 [Salmonella phage 7t3]WNV47296.1 hypothetical protein [Klebsiella phage fENko-Kae01]
MQKQSNSVKVYDLTIETDEFNALMNIYILLSGDPADHIFTSCDDNVSLMETLRFCIHQAECGENVYIVGFPRSIPIEKRPNTLFFLKSWYELMDVSDEEHMLVIAIRDIYGNTGEYYKMDETFKHLTRNIRSLVSISLYAV